MKNILTISWILICAFIHPSGINGQDVSINILMSPAEIHVDEVGTLEVQICNNGAPDIDVTANKIRPLLSVPSQSVEIIGIDSSTNDGWGLLTNNGIDIRINNNINIPVGECHNIYIGILGVTEFELRTITGAMAFNGSPTSGNDVNNDNSQTSVTVLAALPIELLRFNALPGQNHVLLEWATATELNNSHFDIERSADGRQYQKIGEVAGQGTTSEISTYSFTDVAPLNGKSYYRLKQVDYNGAYEYSHVEEVNRDSDSALKLFPNPVAAGSQFRVEGRQIRSVQVFNILGQLVLEESYDRPQNQVFLSTDHLAQGMYITRINNTTEKRMIIK